MKKQKINIETKDGICDCYIADPNDDKTHPAVLLFIDAFGPRDYLYSMADKLCEQGYFVLLPNLFYRSRKAPVIDATFPITKEHMAEARRQLGLVYDKFKAEEGINKK